MKILFDIFKINPMPIKCTIVDIIAAKIKSPRRFHPIKNDTIEGIVIIIATIVPFTNGSVVGIFSYFNKSKKKIW